MWKVPTSPLFGIDIVLADNQGRQELLERRVDRHRLRQDVVMVHLELARVLVQVLEADLFLHEFVTLKAKAQFGDVAATRTTLVNKQFLRSRKHRLS